MYFRYELTDFEWSIIEPLLSNKSRGVPRVDYRWVLNGIYWRLRVISPFLTGCIRRTYAAIFSFMAGVMPPMPMFGRSLL
jgi:hypothetical protein